MILTKGIGASPYVNSGRVRKIHKKEDIRKIESGEVVVVKKASRDMIPHLKRVAGVVTDYGGLTSHVAIVLRELKIPCIVGTEKATKVLKDGMIVTVDGKTGRVYKGIMELEEKIEELPQPKTGIDLKININVPELAERAAPYADGVGSVRIENMVIETGKHPHKLLKEGKLTKTLVDGLRKVVDSFYPKPVWIRTFDIPTDELTALEGSKEPKEPNPLLGYRGITRDLKETEILKAELKALIELIDEGYSNIALKVPFVRDISEYLMVKSILNKMGLKPHRDIKVGVSIETPGSALQIDKFLDVGSDFVSIGLSDITMCTLAVDRRGVKVAKLFNFLHPSILKIASYIIKKCNERNVESCVAGYAATEERIVEKLIYMGVDSISTNIDKLLKMRIFLSRVERKIIENSFALSY